jgi:hypothetical protein
VRPKGGGLGVHEIPVLEGLRKVVVKWPDGPDSVHPACARRDRHSSWPGLSPRLGATYPPAQRAASIQAYLVLLRVEIARFTRSAPLAFASPTPRLVSVALIRTSRWMGVTHYAALCSPDLPPVPPFGACTSGGLGHFTTN